MKKFKRILLIDDDPIANFLHEDLIREVNFAEEVIVKTDAEEALSYLKQQCEVRKQSVESIDLILLDLNMPNIGGFEFLDKMKALPLKKAIEVVILTSSISKKDIETVHQYRVKEFLSKPLTEEDLKLL